jgi:hypothetical protein
VFPSEGVSHDNGQVVVVRLPAEPLTNARGAGNDCRGIARAPRADTAGKIRSRGVFDRIDDFQDGVAAAIAAIQGQVFATGAQMLQGVDMGGRKISDLNIIADAGAVG